MNDKKPPVITVVGSYKPGDRMIIHDDGLPLGALKVSDKTRPGRVVLELTWFHSQFDVALEKSFKRDYPMVSLDNFD